MPALEMRSGAFQALFRNFSGVDRAADGAPVRASRPRREEGEKERCRKARAIERELRAGPDSPERGDCAEEAPERYGARSQPCAKRAL